MPQIGYEVDGPVAVVTIDHHQRRNALTQDMFNALAGAVRAADDDREVLRELLEAAVRRLGD